MSRSKSEVDAHGILGGRKPAVIPSSLDRGVPMTMQIVQSNGIEICYETIGDAANPPVLLIMGLGGQLIGWEDGFCRRLAGRGHCVIRFDNRDAGLSTHVHGKRMGDLLAIAAGDTSTAPYVLEDMADDTAGLMESLRLHAAHLVGLSMGGMIAQATTTRHPERVRSLTTIASNTGDRHVGQPTQEGMAVLFQPPTGTPEEAADRAVENIRLVGSPGFPPDLEGIRDRARRSFERASDPHGVGRQLAALLASPDRTPALHEIRVPTVVIHGDSDPMIDVSGGRATAEAIPGAHLEIIKGMGHDLPRDVWDRIIDLISDNVRRGELAAG